MVEAGVAQEELERPERGKRRERFGLIERFFKQCIEALIRTVNVRFTMSDVNGVHRSSAK